METDMNIKECQFDKTLDKWEAKLSRILSPTQNGKGDEAMEI
jgi:hypothetical protein